MEKLAKGELMPEFTFSTPYEENLSFSEVVKGKKTAVVFLRYYGCTLCQLDMARYAAQYEKIKEAGGQLLIVLQSSAQKIREDLKGNENRFPYSIICDEGQALYQRFGVGAAKSREGMVGANTMKKIEEAQAAGFKHGDYEGNELQLPAYFVVDENRILKQVHYGVSVDDAPSADDLIQYL